MKQISSIRFAAFLLAIFMMLSLFLAACGDGETEETTVGETEAETTDADTEAETTKSEETDPDTAEPVPEPDPDPLKQQTLRVGDKDYAGFEVLINDVEEGLVVSRVTGYTAWGQYYEGKIMLIDDPSRVFVGAIPESRRGPNGIGYRLPEFFDHYDVVAGINGSGFGDANGEGLGGYLIGVCYYEETPWYGDGSYYTSVAFTIDDKLIVGGNEVWNNNKIRDGVQFGPYLIKDGVRANNSPVSVQPRTAIGQREDGVVAFLVIDGRPDLSSSPSQGCDFSDLEQIMEKYQMINASCCDGGASSAICYNRELITMNSSMNPSVGRLLPNAFLVRHKTDKN